MAMPTSGSLSIKATAGTCRNICAAAIQGGEVGSGSLSTLNEQVYPKLNPPGCLTRFYGYNPVTDVPINWVQYAQVGTNGVSGYLTRAYCAMPLPTAGTSYTICIRGHLATVGQPSGSYAGICITCNFGLKMYCCVPYNVCQTPSVSFLVDSNDCVRMYTCVNSTCVACSNCVCMHGCILSVTGTGYCLGTTCCDGKICTG